MSDKPKFPRADAIAACKEILASFGAGKVIVAGSLRRRKSLVGDIEILYIPATEVRQDPSDFFSSKLENLSDLHIQSLIARNILRPRENTLGRSTWGEKNKLAVHVPSGIPVDLFSTSERAWFNYLVCRTGSAENNVRIASAAQRKGWKWHPYSWGFSDASGNPVEVTSERDVFALVGLDYLDPWDR